MVTPEEMQKYSIDEFEEYPKGKTAYKLTKDDIKKHDENKAILADMIAERKKQFEKENNLNSTMAYGEIEDLCQISADTIRKAIASTTKITRKFLYKFTVGLKMDIDEANKYFEKCGGVLTEASEEDNICIRALEQHDTIESMIAEFQEEVDCNIAMRNRKAK